MHFKIEVIEYNNHLLIMDQVYMEIVNNLIY